MSLFSETLAGLLDHDFTNEEWAHILTTTPEIVESWKKDEDIPEPWRLDLVYQIVEEDDDADEALSAFETMAEMPASNVSPLGDLMLPTVWEYMTRPKFDQLTETLSEMDRDEKVVFLREKFLGSTLHSDLNGIE